ncbi:MAG: hypothetical protein OIF50_17570 [Flavobacteriaceae bacterium]|nr:hypothetical protein [Flavobacteriaceae bacterium]
MNLQKILSIVVAVIGIVGAIFWILIAKDGENGPIGGMMTIGMILVGVTAVLAILFGLINVVKSPEKLKKTLFSLGVFIVIGILSYAMAEGVAIKGEEINISESGSKWVGTGLYMFYLMVIAAFAVMAFFGVKKILR